MDEEVEPSLQALLERLRSLEETQMATMNILEDFDAERHRLEDVQRATVNILEDFEVEKQSLEQVQRASINILEDFEEEKQRLEQVQRASINILEDFDGERARLEGMQRATINILEDFSSEKSLLEDSQRALLNILDDIDVERAKVSVFNQKLEATNKELEAFSYSVSHDLSAPLRSLDGFSQALIEDYGDKLDSVGRDYLSRIRGASQRMGMLIDDMLKLSRITRSSMQLARVDLSAIVSAIVLELRQRQPDRRVEFLVKQGVWANGDARLLRIALENLLGNAWKFTEKHPSARIEFGEAQWNGQRAFFVRDDGAGFDMAYANKLFGAFQRLHSSTEFSGTGIGLATVQRVIQRHGGQVGAEGKVDQGATFYFTLPTESPLKDHPGSATRV